MKVLRITLTGLSLIVANSMFAGGFTSTSSLTTARDTHSATLLPNGKVLIAGGFRNGSYLSSAELYDPTNEVWGVPAAPGSMFTARASHTATLLPNGKVLVTGGTISGPNFLSSAELFNPSTVLWTATGNMGTARGQHHTATLLPNGKVLAAGGFNLTDLTLPTAELYDPVSETWSPTGTMTDPRHDHTATLLQSGKVLVAGGLNTNFVSSASAEQYDPTTQTWTVTGSMSVPRYGHTATLLTNGSVLVTGGEGTNGYLASAELFDPATGTWTPTGSMAEARWRHTATLLANGKVLVAGGYTNQSGSNLTFHSSAELYDPATGTWTATGSLKTGRYGHTETLLTNRRVFIVGGDNASGQLSSAELYDADAPLAIARSAANLVVSWPSPSALTLQRTLDVTNPNSWSNYTGVVTNTGPQKTATITNTAANQFFRLGPPLPVINITNQLVFPEGSIGTKVVNFIVTRTGNLSGTSTVNYATSNGDASAGFDYLPASGTLTFGTGVSNQLIGVTVISDTVPEPNEFFFTSISSPTNATIGNTVSTGVILNDD